MVRTGRFSFASVTFDEVLGFVSRRVVDISFPRYIGNNFLLDAAMNAPRFRVPLKVVALSEYLGNQSQSMLLGRAHERKKADRIWLGWRRC
jgi:hypothetical protein